MTFEHLRAGDAVIIGTEGRDVEARVILASSNGLSLALTFDAAIGGWVGGLAALYDAGAWRTLDGLPLTIRKIDLV